MLASFKVIAMTTMLGLASLSLQACSAPKPAVQSETLIDTGDDPAVAASTREAIKTLDAFWSKIDQRDPAASKFVVKLALRADDGYIEHIWANYVSRTDREIVARIADDPVHLKGIAFGSEVRVKPELISDWGYEKAGKLYGYYTTRALMSRMSPEQLAEVEGRLSPKPLETEAR